MNTEQPTGQENDRAGEFRKILELTRSGYAGVMPGTGMIVDRRVHPEATPMQANELLNLPEPKKI